MKKSLFIEMVSALLILLFVYTALSKLLNYKVFSIALERIPILRNHAATVAWLLPAYELLIASLLFIPATHTAGLYMSLVTLIVFTGYLIYMILFLRDLPCSCGGVLDILSWRQHIVFNIFFLIINILGMIMDREASTIKRAPT